MWIIKRRYNEFNQLNNLIKKFNCNIRFPGKRLFGDNFDRDFLNERMILLDQFLKQTVNNQLILQM